MKKQLLTAIAAVVLGAQGAAVYAQAQVERGPWPARFIAPSPATVKFFQERDRQIQEELARDATSRRNPTESAFPYSHETDYKELARETTSSQGGSSMDRGNPTVSAFPYSHETDYGWRPY